MSIRRSRREPAEINMGFQIAPMVDVVFVVMLFFMVLAGAVKIENVHNTKLPGTVATETETTMPDEIAIRIDDEGQVYLNDDPLGDSDDRSLRELVNDLKQLRQSSEASKSEVLVTIYADELARYERIMDTLDALSRAKITHVTFQAGAPD